MAQQAFTIPTGQLAVGQAAAIANGQTTSGVINTGGASLIGLQMPAAFTGTALSFLGSIDGTTFQPVYSTTTGTALSYTVAQGHYVAIDSTPLQGLPFIKIVSNATEAGARSIGLALKGQ